LDRSTTGTALWRRLALGTGPLKRTTDRLQFLARVLLGCTLLMALPIALAVGTATRSEALAESAQQAIERSQVDATLTEDAPRVSGNYDTAPPLPRATAVWITPAGVEREGLVPVPAHATSGSTVRIWIDSEGNRTTEPLSEGAAAARGVANALVTYLCIATLAGGVYFLFRRGLDRRRMRRWDADWAVVEPLWTRRVL